MAGAVVSESKAFGGPARANAARRVQRGRGKSAAELPPDCLRTSTGLPPFNARAHARMHTQTHPLRRPLRPQGVVAGPLGVLHQVARRGVGGEAGPEKLLEEVLFFFEFECV